MNYRYLIILLLCMLSVLLCGEEKTYSLSGIEPFDTIAIRWEGKHIIRILSCRDDMHNWAIYPDDLTSINSHNKIVGCQYNEQELNITLPVLVNRCNLVVLLDSEIVEEKFEIIGYSGEKEIQLNWIGVRNE